MFILLINGVFSGERMACPILSMFIYEIGILIIHINDYHYRTRKYSYADLIQAK